MVITISITGAACVCGDRVVVAWVLGMEVEVEGHARSVEVQW